MSGTRFSIVAAFLHERLDMSDNPYEGFLKAKEAALLAELASVRATLADLSRLSGTAAAKEATPNEQPKPKRMGRDKQNPFSGLTLSDAIIEVLDASTVPQSPGQIWAALHKAGVEATSEDPVKAVSWSLRKRARIQRDVVHCAHGKWNLRSRYSDAQIRKMSKSNTGMGNLTRDDHSERTKVGIEKRRAAGGLIGQPPKMTPERIAEVEGMIRAGKSVSAVARTLGVAPQTIYSRYKKDDVVRLRAEGLAERDKDDDRPGLRVVK